MHRGKRLDSDRCHVFRINQTKVPSLAKPANLLAKHAKRSGRLNRAAARNRVRPDETATDKRRVGFVNQLPGCTGFEPACGTRPLLPITQTQRPVEIGAPDGHRTHISRTESRRSIAVELRDCPRSAQTSSADRGCDLVADLGKVRWARGVIERKHSMPGIEALARGHKPPRLSPRTVRPPYWWRITDQLRPIEVFAHGQMG